MEPESQFAEHGVTLEAIVRDKLHGGRSAVESYLSSRRRQLMRSLAAMEPDDPTYADCSDFVTALAEAEDLFAELAFEPKQRKAKEAS